MVTADGGPGPFSLTILDKPSKTIRSLKPKARRDSDDKKVEDEDEWRSIFMGLAFSGNKDLWAAEGDSGSIRLFDLATGSSKARLTLNQQGFKDSYASDIALDPTRGILWAIDQANFRIAAFDVKTRKMISSTRVGRLPFSLALSPDGKRAYVANIGMFEYKALPGADPKRARETAAEKPVFAFPSKEALKGTPNASALGDPNAPESNSLCVLDLEDPTRPKVIQFIHTGLPFPKSLGGSSPSGVIATADRVYVSNGHNDTVSIVDTKKLAVTATVEIRVPGFEKLRGALPIGMALTADNRLLVALAGLNAIAVIDTATAKPLGYIPAGWFPTRVAVHGADIHVVNAKGAGTGPNASRQQALPQSFQAERRRGSLQVLRMPTDLASSTAQVWKNAFESTTETPLPKAASHVVIIVKENRTYDEVFGDFGGNRDAPALARYGDKISPNHHSMARQWSYGDNFYADSEVSVDGHHWLAGVYPNAWTESKLMGPSSFRLPTTAPGRLQFPESNSSVHPEEQLEAGAIWHHLERNKVSFRNFGEGFELAGTEEGPGLMPTGTRFLTNVPVSAPLYRNTSWDYPGYNTNIPDQYRATQFIKDIRKNFVDTNKELPRLIFIHLPNDHTTRARPGDGYPTVASYVADNDYAMGRIVEFLSNTRWWKNMTVLVTEDDAQGGVDHIDSHRTVLLAAGPYVKRGYVIRNNASFPGLLKTAFRLLGIPPLNLFDATATDLSDAFTNEPDFTPYKLLPIDPAIFDPAKAKDPMDGKPLPMSERMDDPRVLREQHRKR